MTWITRAAVGRRSVTLLLAGGLFVGGPVGAGLLAVVVLVVAWLLYLGWPRMTTSERLGHTAVLLLAVALCLTTMFPR